MHNDNTAVVPEKSPATGLLVDVTDLAVRFGGEVEALRGVSFSLERGESLAIVGESGSGKSTLAKCLAGLIQPPEARGSVRVNGVELLGASEEDLRSVRWSVVALALQGSPFNPVVTVGDQVAEPLRERLGMGARESGLRAAKLAREVLLDPALLDRYPHQLSGGQRRRATIAMVLALDPALVVLDEPTAGLDPATRHELVQRLVRLADDRGFAMVVISHDLPDAASLATRTMVLYAGEVMEEGSTARVIAEPAHPYSWGPHQRLPGYDDHKGPASDQGTPSRPPSGAPWLPVQPALHPGREHLFRRPSGAFALP